MDSESACDVYLVLSLSMFAAQTFPSHFQHTSSNGSLGLNYPIPVQTYDDGPNAVPDNGHPLLASHGQPSTG